MIKKTLLIRADASLAIGMGHRVRCQVLASLFSSSHWQVSFVCHDTCADFSQPQDHLISKEADFLPLASAADLVILDHYGYDSSMMERLFQVQHNILLFDDMNDRGPLFCRWILNPVTTQYEQSFISLKKTYRVTPTPFIGPEYALLRPQFFQYKPPTIANKLLITMGGTDPLALTLPLLQRLKVLGFPLEHIVVMQGANAQQAKEVKAFCDQHLVSYQQGVKQVASLMQQAKLAISAGGSTLFELAAMSVPSIFIQVAENQTRLLDEHEKLGWCHVYRLETDFSLLEQAQLVNQVCQLCIAQWQDRTSINQSISRLKRLNLGQAYSSILDVIEQDLH